MRYRGEIRPAVRRGSIREFFGSDPNLKANWTFNEVGSNVLDVSGNAYHGTVSGTKIITQGKFDSAFSFNGSTTITVSVPLTFSTGVTIALWLKIPIFTSHKGLLQWGTASGYGCYFHYTSASNITLWCIPQGWDSSTWIPVANMSNQWFSAIFTIPSISGEYCKGFKNGVDTGGGVPIGTPTNRTLVSIGNYYDVASNKFLGVLDETAIFSRVLSPAEISQYYQWAISEPRKYWFYNPVVAGVYMDSYFYRHLMAGGK